MSDEDAQRQGSRIHQPMALTNVLEGGAPTPTTEAPWDTGKSIS